MCNLKMWHRVKITHVIMKRTLYILTIILSLTNCSDISKESLKSGTEFSAHISINDDPNTEVLEKIVVKLFDKEGDAIATKRIKISINNHPLKLFMQRGNYYDVTHWYLAEDIPNDQRYYIDIIMEDSTKYELAAFKPFGKVDTKNATIVKNNINGDYIIQWESLKDFDEVRISRGFEVHKENETVAMDSIITQTINSKNGFIDIEKSSTIHDTLGAIEYLYVTFFAKKGGLLNTELLEHSTIVVTSEFSINAREILKH